MTTLDRTTDDRPLRIDNPILNVVRLQFVNTQTFIWVPMLVLCGAWLVTVLSYWIIQGAGASGVMIGGGAQAPLWYFLVVGAQAMTLTFPFSQAMSLTRREFYLGSLVAAAVSGLAMSIVFVLLGLFEQATDGYGMNGYFAYLPWVWDTGPAAAGFSYVALTLLSFVIGFWFATVYKRFGMMVLSFVLLGIVLALVGLIALVTWQQTWPSVTAWVADAGALGLSFWVLLVTALLAIGSYATLRRMPA